jgi:parvulin-like peptidyl-prolyl isomerase
MELISDRHLLAIVLGCTVIVSSAWAGDETGEDQTLAGTEILAIVGDRHILQGDVMPRVLMAVQPVLDKLTVEEKYLQRREIEQQKSRLLQQMLMQEVETKLLYMAFLQDLSVDQRQTAEEHIESKLKEMFEDAVLEMLKKIALADKQETRDLFRSAPQVARLAKLMDMDGIETIAELDQLLSRFQTSVELERDSFKERNLGRSFVSDKIRKRPEVNHREMLKYYRENIDKYEFDSTARWEQLSVYFENVDSRDDAYTAVATMGNEVLQGAKLEVVARRGSQDSRAAEGGLHDWTPKGSLVSEPIDLAVFHLPLEKLSRIIEDGRGFHIVRVLERRQAGRVAFQDVQKEIKKKLLEGKQQDRIDKLLKELRDAIPIWTVYDGQ